MKRLNKNKPTTSNIIFKFFFYFLIPYVLINGIIFFLFIQSPTINVVANDSQNYEENKIKFSIECLLPLSYIKTYFQNEEIPYTKFGDYYSVDVSENGTYQIKVLAINQSKAETSVNIETIDSTPPNIDIDNAIVAGNTLILSVNDDQTEINYDKVYATKDNGDKIDATYIDKVSGTVQFQVESGEKIVVHIEDMIGNSAETSFTLN